MGLLCQYEPIPMVLVLKYYWLVDIHIMPYGSWTDDISRMDELIYHIVLQGFSNNIYVVVLSSISPPGCLIYKFHKPITHTCIIMVA